MMLSLLMVAKSFGPIKWLLDNWASPIFKLVVYAVAFLTFVAYIDHRGYSRGAAKIQSRWDQAVKVEEQRLAKVAEEVRKQQEGEIAVLHAKNTELSRILEKINEQIRGTPSSAVTVCLPRDSLSDIRRIK